MPRMLICMIVPNANTFYASGTVIDFDSLNEVFILFNPCDV